MKGKLPWRCRTIKQAKDKATIYNSREWKELRALKIRSTNGLCEECMKEGIVTAANIVHHKHPIEDSHSMQEMKHWAFMWENLLVVCQAHHAKIHRDQLKSNTKDVVKQRAEARRERWADGLMQRFTVKGSELDDNQSTMNHEP